MDLVNNLHKINMHLKRENRALRACLIEVKRILFTTEKQQIARQIQKTLDENKER